MPWLIVVLGYFLGSIPAAYIAGHLLKGRDIRQMGDTNVGAANAFHQLGKKIGIAIGIIDAGKGALAVLIAQAAHIPQDEASSQHFRHMKLVLAVPVYSTYW